MSDVAKKAREAMKAKARRLAGEKDQKVDSSDWSPAEPLNADVKTGMRPVGKAREYSAGGMASARRADRRGRKAGGKVMEKEIGVGMANKDMKEANEQREGKKHIGGMKRGGALPEVKVPKPARAAAQHYKRGGKAGGGSLPSPEEAMKSEQRLGGLRATKAPAQSFSKDQAASYAREEGYAAADRRAGRKRGGRAKGKTDIKINIISAGGKPGPMPMLPPDGAPTGGVAPVPMPAPGGVPGPMMPPAIAAPPPMPAPGPMPMGRKAGGRVSKVASSYKDMEAGACSGEGRLQKTDIAKKHRDAPARKAGGRAPKSYRGMTAGAESGKGRLQKTAIEKSQRARGA